MATDRKSRSSKPQVDDSGDAFSAIRTDLRAFRDEFQRSVAKLHHDVGTLSAEFREVVQRLGHLEASISDAPEDLQTLVRQSKRGPLRENPPLQRPSGISITGVGVRGRQQIGHYPAD